MLVRREISTVDQSLVSNRITVVAEFVTNFKVSFIADDNSGQVGLPPVLTLYEDTAAQTLINGGGVGGGNPERVRAVIVELDVRTTAEDPDLPFTIPDGGVATTFEVDEDVKGSSRIRHARIEIPVPNISSRNL